MIQSILVSAVAVAGLWAAGPLLPASPLAEQAPAVSAPAPAPVGACAPQGAAQAPVQAVAAPAPSTAGPSLNTATAAELDALPVSGLGAKRAQHVVEYRQAHGAFKSAQELRAVPGLPGDVADQLAAHVHV